MEKYSGRALEIKEFCVGSVDKIYKNHINGIYWYINCCEYLHVLEPCEVKLDFFYGHYTIMDYILTKDDKFRSTVCNGIYGSLQSVIKELERRIQ